MLKNGHHGSSTAPILPEKHRPALRKLGNSRRWGWTKALLTACSFIILCLALVLMGVQSDKTLVAETDVGLSPVAIRGGAVGVRSEECDFFPHHDKVKLQNLHLVNPKPSMFNCCWRKQILSEALDKSDKLKLTDDPDEVGAHWLLDLPYLLRGGYDANEVVGLVRDSLKRRQKTAAKQANNSGAKNAQNDEEDLGWRIYVIDHTDRGVFPKEFEAKHFCEIAGLVGPSNVYFAQRSRVDGREASDDPERQFHVYGHPRDYSSLTDISGGANGRCIHGTVWHLDYTVRADLLNAIASILREDHNSDLSPATFPTLSIPDDSNLISAALFDRTLDPIVGVERPHDVVHFWDPDEKANNAVLRTMVSQRVQSMGERYSDVSAFAGLAGQRSVAGRKEPQGDYAEALLQYKIVIVCQRDSHETHYRLMEALISGALVMTDPVHYFPDGIEEGRHIVVYRSLDDLEDKILYYLKNDKEREAIARNGWNVALQRQRSWHWLEDFVLGPWPTKDEPLPMIEPNPLVIATTVTAAKSEDVRGGEGKNRNKEEDSSSITMEQKGLGVPANAKRSSMPLFIAAGQGTTGTRSMHDAMCELGVPSVHYIKACYRRDPSDEVDASLEEAVEAHFEAMDAWRDVMGCAKNTKMDEDCAFEEGVRLEGVLRGRIERVVRSGIGAVHDTPYPKYLPLMLNVTTTASKDTPRIGDEGSPPPAVLITSERDPKEWSVKRSTGHSHDIICKNPAAAFDFALCVDLAKEKRPQPTSFGDIFWSYDRCETDEERDKFVATMEDAMRRYQRRVDGLNPTFRVNFWREAMNTSTLAAGIWNVAAAALTSSNLGGGDSSGLVAEQFGYPLRSEVRKMRKKRHA
eukprot:CAMPEP_0197446832 /NCGR_PEP_ID=MMETSP1175-20131217/11673_1 /TAXON_ID=1003142 /ORGANISM="Triceratium dubium, Strain CCMP147" /LENGTH=860 /DNA_ID=CAMNT_0042977997 /DNA_START=1930 /DNA_END=4512 /DNA_ORIENTATION=+